MKSQIQNELDNNPNLPFFLKRAKIILTKQNLKNQHIISLSYQTKFLQKKNNYKPI